MGIHSLSNSNKKRNLYHSKHRVISIKKKQKRLQRAQLRQEGHVDPVDLELMHEFHSKKRMQGASANVALSGKKRRKLLKAYKRNEREKLEKALAEDAEAEARVEAESSRSRKVRDVEMKETPEDVKDDSESEDLEGKDDAEMET